MNLQAQDYSLSGAALPPGCFASQSFSFERVISPRRRLPALPHANLQPTRLWHCSLDALRLSQPGRTSARPADRLASGLSPELPRVHPAVAPKIDPTENLLVISPATVSTGIPPTTGIQFKPAHGNLLAKHRSGCTIRPDFNIWVSDPEALSPQEQSRTRSAESPLLSKDWPVVGGSASLVPAPLLEWQIERQRQRRRNANHETLPPVRSVRLPDPKPEAAETPQKVLAVSFQVTRATRRWLAAAASLAILALGAARFGPSAIDNLNKTLEPRASFVFFDDPSTGVGPWWPSENFIETEDRTFAVTGLALNKSTIGRGDLRFDFDVKAGSGGFGWVAGAKDEKNYLAYKLTLKGRRKKEYVLLRYAVVNGEPDPDRRDEFPVSADLFEKEFNKISVRVREDKLTVLINGQGVDYWTSPGVARGGVGFYADQGDSPAIRSVRVDGNDDFTGLMARGTIDTLKSVRDLLAGESESRGRMVNSEIRVADPSD